VFFPTDIVETNMHKSGLLGVAIALSVGMLFAATDMASAQKKAKKLTYEQAWAACQKDVQTALPGDTTQSAARYTRGAACMKIHGYRLKKSSLKM
jgi:penicillin V acylase-like amidase (Ntn superfamily)